LVGTGSVVCTVRELATLLWFMEVGSVVVGRVVFDLKSKWPCFRNSSEMISL